MLLSYVQDTTTDDDATDIRAADLRKAPTIGPERIIAERLESGVLKYQVKWAPRVLGRLLLVATVRLHLLYRLRNNLFCARLLGGLLLLICP